MCNLSEGIREEAREELREEVREELLIELAGRFHSQGWTIDRIVQILGDYDYIRDHISKLEGQSIHGFHPD